MMNPIRSRPSLNARLAPANLDPDNRWLWLALVPLLLLMMGQGARGLNADILYPGEFHSINHADEIDGLRIDGVLASVADRSPQHSPGYFVLLGWWAQFVGWQVPLLRALALLLALPLIAWTYRLGCDLASPVVGLYGAIIAGTCVYFIDFTHSLRQYTLLPLLTLVTLWLYLSILRRRPRWWGWLLLYFSAAGLLYTHYMGIFPLAFIGLYHLLWLLDHWQKAGRAALHTGRWWGVVSVMLLVGLSFLPWVGVVLNGMAELDDLSPESLSIPQTFDLLAALYSNGIVLLPVIGLLLALVALWRREKGAALLWYWVALPFVSLLLFHLASPLLTDDRLRYLIFLLPLIALLIGVGLARLGYATVIAPLLLVGLFLAGQSFVQTERFLMSNSTGTRLVGAPPLHQIAPALSSMAQPDDYFLGLTANRLVVRRRELPTYYLRRLLGIDAYQMSDSQPSDGIASQSQELVNAAAAHRVVWFMFEPARSTPLVEQVRGLLGERYTACGIAFEQGDVRIEQYAAEGDCRTQVANGR
jgi:hypothetical protein